MQKVRLPNGLTVLFEPKKGNSAVVEVMVKVGSNDEAKKERGLSHFIEHMLFEGTTKRPTNREISNEIEKIGGDFNAYTTNERTCFYVKVLKKHFPKAVEVLGDILSNSVFNPKELEKEKKIVLKEIDLVNDEPKFYQWILLQQNLFQKHPVRYPTYGRKDVIKGLTREKILGYFHSHYVPSNMLISIVGDVKTWKPLLLKHFALKTGKRIIPLRVKEPPAKRNVEVKVHRDVTNSYLVMGFKTVPRSHADSYVLEVINGILGRGQSGKMFTEIRGKKGLAYDVGTQHLADVDFGYFAVYATIDGKNIQLVRKLILEELGKLQQVTEQEVQEAKTYLEGDCLLDLEDGQKMADQLLFWAQVKDAHLLGQFIPRVKKVTVADVKRVAAKYFKYYTMAVVEGR